MHPIMSVNGNLDSFREETSINIRSWRTFDFLDLEQWLVTFFTLTSQLWFLNCTSTECPCMYP